MKKDKPTKKEKRMKKIIAFEIEKGDIIKFKMTTWKEVCVKVLDLGSAKSNRADDDFEGVWIYGVYLDPTTLKRIKPIEKFKRSIELDDEVELVKRPNQVRMQTLREPWGGARIYRVHTGKEYKDFYCESDALEYKKEQKTLLGELKTLMERVEHILEESEETRKDDWTLYGAYLDQYTDVDKEITIGQIILEHKLMELPSFASITRARRKVQERRPELKDSETAVKREDAEGEYREFAKI